MYIYNCKDINTHASVSSHPRDPATKRDIDRPLPGSLRTLEANFLSTCDHCSGKELKLHTCYPSVLND